MKVIKHYQRKYKKGVAVPLLRSLYDLQADIYKVITLLEREPELDIKTQLAEWCNQLKPLIIKDAINEVNYATQERLQITRGKGATGRKKEKKKEVKK